MYKMRFRRFNAVIKSWEAVLQEAADFASFIGPNRVVSISHSEDHGTSDIVVWYWDEREAE